jgi:predicted MFS family arabinose efflux permease
LREVFSFAVAIVAIAQIGLGLAAVKMYAIYGFLILFFLGFNFLEASLPSLISRVVPKDLKGTALGVYSTCQFMGIFLGGWVGGWLHGRLGIDAVYFLSALLAVIWLPLATTMPNISRRAVAESYTTS